MPVHELAERTFWRNYRCRCGAVFHSSGQLERHCDTIQALDDFDELLRSPIVAPEPPRSRWAPNQPAPLGTQIQPAECPACQSLLNVHADGFDEPKPPKMGDFCICGMCGSLIEWIEPQRLRVVPLEEQARMSEEDRAYVRSARAYLQAQGPPFLTKLGRAKT